MGINFITCVIDYLDVTLKEFWPASKIFEQQACTSLHQSQQQDVQAGCCETYSFRIYYSALISSCPCLRNLSFGRRIFCCRSTNSMYRPSGSQYFLVRICLPCHPHLPCRPFASRLVERTEDTQLFFHLVFWVLFSVSLLLSSGEIIWWIHWKYDDFPGPMRLPLAMFQLKNSPQVAKLVSILCSIFK